MSAPSRPPPGADPLGPVAYWNGAAGDRWVAEQPALDAMLRPYGEAAIAAAGVVAGEAVLDVGCGCGDTTVALADRVGPEGRVLGVDVSAPMLARARVRCAGRATVSLSEGDAGSSPLGDAAFDLLFSRFGVMFFVDPVAAFRHARGALRPAGRVAFVCWRPLAENPWAAVPLEAAARVLGPSAPVPPDAPGPFSLRDARRVGDVLGAAGFVGVTARPFEHASAFGAGGSLANAAAELARTGPVARLLIDRDAADVARVVTGIEDALRPWADPAGGASLPGAAWIVTARSGPGGGP